MAFNREDLITWNELAPSLQTIFKALQTEVMASSQRVSKVISKVDELPNTNSVDSQIEAYIENKLLPNLGSTDVIKDANLRINSLQDRLSDHINSTNPHPNTGADFLIHQTNHAYSVDDRVYEYSLPTYYVLECLEAGTSGHVKPNFSQILQQMQNS